MEDRGIGREREDLKINVIKRRRRKGNVGVFTHIHTHIHTQIHTYIDTYIITSVPVSQGSF